MSEIQQTYSVVLADDHPAMRHAIRDLLVREIKIQNVMEAENGEQAFELIKQERADIAILDINMPGMDGFAVTKKINQFKLPVDIIVFTMYKDEATFKRAVDLGVRGFIVKENAVNEIITCIRTVLAGGTFVSPSLSKHFLERDTNPKLPHCLKYKGLELLTDTEKKIIFLLWEMKANKQIADELHISIKTVENHRSNICRKLQIKGHYGLVKYLIRNPDIIHNL